ncbi:hypothetical protein [Kitasatospora sp. NPDC050543]|uniref:hypothetical protein n=1 Tax=Kitasatospora sp. NPDC050543 TaxID=3364054 RepID=UPI0037AA8ABD
MTLLEGRTMVLVGRASRFVRATNLSRAIQLGRAVFGATSFAVLEGPLGAPDSRIWAVATDITVGNEALEVSGGQAATGSELKAVKATVERVLTDRDGHRYEIVTVITKERNTVSTDLQSGLRLHQRLAAGGAELAEEKVRALVFTVLDPLVDQALAGDAERLREAADRLAELDGEAFALVDWITKSRYLTVLIKAWTWKAQQRAIVELMRSLQSVAELDAVRQRLAEAKVATQLFEDLGDDLWDLLVTVGIRFGGREKLTDQAFTALVVESFALPPGTRQAIRENALTGAGEELTDVLRLQVMSAAGAVVSMLRGMIEGLELMVTRPDQVIIGIGQLARLLVVCELSGYGYAPAQAEIRLLVQQIGPKLAAGLRGAAVLHVGPNVLSKIRWAVAVEVASWFIGIGEIKAAAEAVGLTEKLAVLARFLGLIGKAAETAEGQRAVLRLTRLARAMRAGSTVLREAEGEAEVIRLLSHLPAEEQARLARLLERHEIAEGATLAQLSAHPQLGEAVQRSVRKAEILQTFAGRSGGLTDELGAWFRHLAGPGGFEERELAAMAQALKPGEGGTFLAALERIGFRRIGAGGEVGAGFLTALAGSPRGMNAVRAVGWKVTKAAFEHAGGEAERFEAVLLEVARAQEQARRKDRAAAFASMLEQLGHGDTEAWQLVTGMARAGQMEHADVLAWIERTRSLYRGTPLEEEMGKRLDGLRRVSNKDRQRAADAIEEIERRLAATGEKSFVDQEELARIFDEVAKWASEEEKLLARTPGEIPPAQTPEVSRTRHPRTRKTRRGELLEPGMTEARARGEDLHHIIEHGDPRAEVLRYILDEAGIDVLTAEQSGIFLPRTSMDGRTAPRALTRHQTLHTKGYLKEQIRRLLEGRENGTVAQELAVMKAELQDGVFFHIESGADKRESWTDWLVRHREDFVFMSDDEFDELVEATRRAPRAAAPAPVAAPAPHPAPAPAPVPEPEPLAPEPRVRVAPGESAAPLPEEPPDQLPEELDEPPARAARRLGDDDNGKR